MNTPPPPHPPLSHPITSCMESLLWLFVTCHRSPHYWSCLPKLYICIPFCFFFGCSTIIKAPASKAAPNHPVFYFSITRKLRQTFCNSISGCPSIISLSFLVSGAYSGSIIMQMMASPLFHRRRT